MRLYPDLPIYYAAERDGALQGAWEPGDEGAGRRKGYNLEHPWRFLDPRTRLAYELARELRDALGTYTELSQLAAVAAFAESRTDLVSADVPALAARVGGEVAALEALLGRLGRGERQPDEARRGAAEPATPVLFAGPCNNGCAACPNRERWLDDSDAALLGRVEAARATGLPVVLAGREPTLHPAFLRAVQAARGSDGRRVGVVSNGRAFAYPRLARAAVAAGLGAASLKLFGVEAASADAVARVDGAFAQAVAGAKALRAAGLQSLELRLPLERGGLTRLSEAAGLAVALGAQQVRFEVALDALGLDNLAAATEALEQAVRACAQRGVAVEVSPLQAGAQWFARCPGVSGRRGK